MRSYQDWKISETLKQFSENDHFVEWFDDNLQPLLNEVATTSRYSVEVNFRSKVKEVLEAYARISLGYVSAGMKQSGYHVKHVFDDKPIRILVSSRNWDSGEWVGFVLWNSDHNHFMIGAGFYNKSVKTISIHNAKKTHSNSAAELTTELRNLMHHLKQKPDKHREELKGAPMKRGPKS